MQINRQCNTKVLFGIIIFSFFLSISACSTIRSDEAVSNEPSSPTPNVEIMKPYSILTPNGYPYPQEFEEPEIPDYLLTPVSIPEPSKDAGVVTGKIINLETKEPMPFQTVYLGVMVFLTPAPGYTYHIYENSSPHTMTDVNGTFVLDNVPPGDYIILVWTPFGAYVIHDNQGEKIVKSRASRLLDLGALEAIDPMKHTPSP